MRAIPESLKLQIKNSGINDACAYCGSKLNVEWHHVWIYGGKQINEIWAIVGACKYHHGEVNKNNEIKEFFEIVSLTRAYEEDLEKYPKKDWELIKRYLFKR